MVYVTAGRYATPRPPLLRRAPRMRTSRVEEVHRDELRQLPCHLAKVLDPSAPVAFHGAEAVIVVARLMQSTSAKPGSRVTYGRRDGWGGSRTFALKRHTTRCV